MEMLPNICRSNQDEKEIKTVLKSHNIGLFDAVCMLNSGGLIVLCNMFLYIYIESFHPIQLFKPYTIPYVNFYSFTQVTETRKTLSNY